MWFWPRKKKNKKPTAKTYRARSDAAALTREVAAVHTDLHEPLSAYLGIRPNRDPLLTYQTPDAPYAYPYGLFEEAIDKDAHLAAILGQRKAAVLSLEQNIVPTDSSPQAARAAALVRTALAGISRQNKNGDGGFNRDLAELLDAIPYGLAVSEILWERVAASSPQKDALLLPRALLSRHPRRFVFGADGELKLLTTAEPVRGEPLPQRKFLVFAPYGRHENPYGHPQLRSVWWLAYFKRQVLKFWVMYCEKHGTPTAVLTHPPSATDREKKAYRRIIGSIQQETGLVVPEGVELSLLEAQRAGTVTTYRELVEFCNREMSKAILGQTLTTEPSERGTYSLGRVHLSVREDIVSQDAAALMALINGQLIPWIVDLNLPVGARRYPRFELKPPPSDDLKLQLEIDRFFTEQDLALDETELYERYGRNVRN